MEGNGWTCDTQPNAVLTTLKYAFAWRSIAWWQKYKNIEYDDGPQPSHKKAAEMEMAQSRCVWEKIASEGSGGKEWSIKRKRCQNAAHKRDFVTFALISE